MGDALRLLFILRESVFQSRWSVISLIRVVVGGEQSRGEVNRGWSAYRVCFPYMHHFPESLVRGKRRGPDQGGPS